MTDARGKEIEAAQTVPAEVFTMPDGRRIAIAHDPNNPRQGWAIPLPAPPASDATK